MNSRILIVAVIVCVARSASSLTFGWGSCLSTPLISDFNAYNYSGKWYELQRFTPLFEIGLSCVTATYGYLNSSAVTVRNLGIQLSNGNRTNDIQGVATVPDASKPNSLVVQFPLNVFGYNVFTTNGDYNVWMTDYVNYSVVYGCQQLISKVLRLDTVWILSRTKTLDQSILDSIYTYVASRGLDVSQFDIPSQACDN